MRPGPGITDLLREAVSSGPAPALLLTTHDVPLVREWTDRLLIMAAGQVVDAGLSAQVLDAPAHPATRGLLS